MVSDNLSSNISKIFYQAVDDFYFEKYYEIKCKPVNIVYSGYLNSPDKDLLRISFLEKINADNCKIYFLLVNGEIATHIQIEYFMGKSCEISYSSLIEGKGFACDSLFEALKVCILDKIHTVYLHIAVINLASIAIAKKNGFVKTGRASKRYLPVLGSEFIYEEWIKYLAP